MKIKLRIKFIILFIAMPLIPLLVVMSVYQITPVAWMILFLAISASSLVAIILANRTVSPIEKVQEATKQFGEGRLDFRLHIKTNDEIEDLANGFNSMAEKLMTSISALREDKEMISAERNKLAVTLSGIADAVIAVDNGQNVVIFNNASENITGLLAHDVLGRPISSLIRIFDDDKELLPSQYCPIRTDTFEGVIFSKKNIKVLSAANKQAFVDMVTGKISEGPNVNLGCILVLHDITGEKKLEEMKLDFVSMAAHELRTPLTSLKGYLSVFMEDNEKMFNKEQLMFLNRINISAQQLTNLVENLLSVSRIERGAFTIRMQSLDWTKTVLEVVDELTGRAKEKNIELSFAQPQELLPNVLADKIRIDEVLNNLLSNAITYTQSGGKITVSIEKKEREVITHVTDTGSGIPKEALSHLFTKFFRVSAPLEVGSKGTGLGLYISKAIITMHRGRIWVESEVGKGSTFSFTLPIAPTQQSPLGQLLRNERNHSRFSPRINSLFSEPESSPNRRSESETGQGVKAGSKAVPPVVKYG